MDESEDLLYQSTQGMQKMNVDSRDETDHQTTATASTAAATHSYSIDDGSTGRVSESGTEVVHMPPRTIGATGHGAGTHGAASSESTRRRPRGLRGGVPGVGLIMLTMVLQQVGLPVEGIMLIIGVDRLLDMARTIVNVAGDAMVATIVARSENKLDLERYADMNAGAELDN